jgi:hypothetical protein
MKWQGIICHHTASDDTLEVELDGIKNYHMIGRGWSDIGYQYVIEQIEDQFYAIQGRPLYKAGSHSRGQNKTHIGVAFVGNFMNAVPHKDQLQVGAELIAGLCKSLDIPVEEVKCHRDFRDTKCPGDRFPFDELIAKIRVLIE